MDPMKTSQQSRGEHHLPEGHESAVAPEVQYGAESSGGGDPLKTSQQKRGEHSITES